MGKEKKPHNFKSKAMSVKKVGSDGLFLDGQWHIVDSKTGQDWGHGQANIHWNIADSAMRDVMNDHLAPAVDKFNTAGPDKTVKEIFEELGMALGSLPAVIEQHVEKGA